MSDDMIEKFKKERDRLQRSMMDSADTSMKRFLALDSRVYEDGALDRKQKELLGLVASTVLRCDDCINYHLDTCKEIGVADDELIEAFDIALVVGGSITIHISEGPSIRGSTWTSSFFKKRLVIEIRYPASLPGSDYHEQHQDDDQDQ